MPFCDSVWSMEELSSDILLSDVSEMFLGKLLNAMSEVFLEDRGAIRSFAGSNNAARGSETTELAYDVRRELGFDSSGELSIVTMGTGISGVGGRQRGEGRNPGLRLAPCRGREEVNASFRGVGGRFLARSDILIAVV
jgi:hypothetical protein